MKITKIIPLAVSVAALLTVTGCSNTIQSPAAIIAAVTGSVFDGAISGATVCMDVNKDDVCNAGEPTAVTDIFGSFSMNANGLTGPLIMSGGTDTGTGLPFTGTMSAPAGSTAVSPLTSAMQSLVKTGATPEAAEASIKKALNITSNAKLTSFNPFVASDAQGADAKEVLAAQSQLQVLVHAVSSTVAGSGTGKTIKDTMGDAINSIAKSLETAATLATANNTNVVITNKLVSDATKATANKVFEASATDTAEQTKAKDTAKVAAKSLADSSAETANALATDTKNKVEASATVATATLASNTGILVANDSMESTLKTASTAANAAAAALSEADLAAIALAQKNSRRSRRSNSCESGSDSGSESSNGSGAGSGRRSRRGGDSSADCSFRRS